MHHFDAPDVRITDAEIIKLFEQADFGHLESVIRILSAASGNATLPIPQLDVYACWICASMLFIGRLEGIRSERKRRREKKGARHVR